MIENILLDCDGVLYPLSELPTREIVEAMKFVYREYVGLKPDEQKFVSEKTISEKHLGMFNYIKEICAYKKYDFETYCRQLAEHVNYSHICENKHLWNVLQNLKNNYNIGILSNNSRPHLDAVFKQVFHKDIGEVEQAGIKAFDITSTEFNGHFYPKQHEKGLALFLQKQNMKADETVLFDDAPVNIEKAKEIGMRAGLVSAENSVLSQLQKLKPLNIITGKTYE